MIRRKHKSNDWQPKTGGKWKNIQWTSHTEHIDIDTGEILTKNRIHNEHYNKVTTEKHYTISQYQPKGHIQYTQLYRKDQQSRLWD